MINTQTTAKIRTSISHVVTSESWRMASGTPHRNENMICSDSRSSATAYCQHMNGGGVHRVSSWSMQSHSTASEWSMHHSVSQFLQNTWCHMSGANVAAGPTLVPKLVMQSVHSEHSQCALSLQWGTGAKLVQQTVD